MKRLFLSLFISSAVFLTVLSCKDDFNEEDFLKLQSELKLKEDSISRSRDKAALDSTSQEAVKEFIAAANTAGDLMAVTLLVRENNNPLAGVTVSINTTPKASLSSGREGATQAVVTGTTDATGTVVFDKVVIGSGTMTLSKTGFISATAIVDFGVPAAPREIWVENPNTGNNVVNYLPPAKVFQEAAVQMFSATPSEGSTATIKGKVLIQTDLTNLTAEVPSNIVIRANLSNLAVAPTANSSFILAYQLADNSSLGVATVAANGDYSMTVPATATGSNISLLIPNIEGTAKIAVNGYDNGTGTAITLPNGPEYRDVPTSWGPQAPAGYGTTVPTVVGAKVVFPEPPAAGTGLAFDFVEVPRSIPTSVYSSAQNSYNNSVYFKITDRGEYSSGAVPTIAISGGGGTGAKATAYMRTYVSAITVNSAGSNYVGGMQINIYKTLADGSDVLVGQFSVQSVNGGLPATIDLTFANGYGFSVNNQAVIESGVTGLKTTVTGTGGSGAQVSAVFKTELASVSIDNGGTGFTSKPTFTFSGGGLTNGDAKHADFEITDFGVQWTINPNNSVATDYLIMPSAVTILYPSTPGQNSFSAGLVDVYSASGIQESSVVQLLDQLTLSASRVIRKDPARTLRTSYFSSAKPSSLVTTVKPVKAVATIAINQINPTTGEISGITPSDYGDGYNTNYTGTILPAVASAPGTGATFLLTNANNINTNEYQWGGGYSIRSGGSGYLRNLNQGPAVAPSLPTFVSSVQPGKTYTVDINYGTGNRKVNIN